MNKLDIAKKAVSFVVGAGVSKIVAGIIQNNTSPEKLTDKVALVSASLVVGAMATDATSKYTNAKIDELATWYNENVKNRFQNSQS
jgi:hypothetical protein